MGFFQNVKVLFGGGRNPNRDSKGRFAPKPGAAEPPTVATKRAPLPDGAPRPDGARRAGVGGPPAKRNVDGLIGRAAAGDAEVNELAAAFWRWAAHPDSFEHKTAPDPKFQYTPADAGLPDTYQYRAAAARLGYEQYLRQPLPVFVYGTLRQGQGNSGLMKPAVKEVRAGRVHGVAIYGNGFMFPYAIEHDDPAAVTVGELVELDGGREGRDARARLDGLESFDPDFPSASHYERRDIEVEVQDSPGGPVSKVKGWIYVARGFAAEGLKEHDRVPDGDWVAAKEEHRHARGARGGLPW